MRFFLFSFFFSFSFMVLAHDQQEWGDFLKKLQQQAKAFSFYYDSQVALYLSKDLSIQKMLLGAESYIKIKNQMMQQFSIDQESGQPLNLREKVMHLNQRTIQEDKISLMMANQYQNDLLFWEAVAAVIQEALQREKDFTPEAQEIWVNQLRKDLFFLLSLSFKTLHTETILYLKEFYPKEVTIYKNALYSNSESAIIYHLEEGMDSPELAFFKDFLTEKTAELISHTQNLKAYYPKLLALFDFFEKGRLAKNDHLFFEKSSFYNVVYDNALEYFSFLKSLDDWLAQLLERSPQKRFLMDSLNDWEIFLGNDLVSHQALFDQTSLLWPLIYRTYDRIGFAYHDSQVLKQQKEIDTKKRHLNLLRSLNAQCSRVSDKQKAEQSNLEKMVSQADLALDFLVREKALQTIPIITSLEERADFLRKAVSQFAAAFQQKGGGIILDSQKKVKQKQKKKKKKAGARAGVSEVQEENFVLQSPEAKLPASYSDSPQEEEEGAALLGPGLLGKIQEILEESPEEEALVGPPPSVMSSSANLSSLDPFPVEAPPTKPQPSVSTSKPASLAVKNELTDLERVLEIGEGARICQMSLGVLYPGPLMRTRGQVTGSDFHAWVRGMWRTLISSQERETREQNKEQHKRNLRIQEQLNRFYPQGRTQVPLPLFDDRGAWTGDDRLYTIDLPHVRRDAIPFLTLKHFLKAILINANMTMH